MIRWFAKNGIAANLLMLAIVVAGLYTAYYRIPLEVTPQRDYRAVRIEMTYHGATAKDVERAILIPIEQSLEGIQGLDELDAEGDRGRAEIWLRAKPGVDLNVFLDDVQARVEHSGLREERDAVDAAEHHLRYEREAGRADAFR